MKQRYVKGGVCTTSKLVNICAILTLVFLLELNYGKYEHFSVNFVDIS